MNDKKQARIRRATKGREKIRKQDTHRLSVNRTPRHIYAQITSASGDQVMAAASTVMGEVKSNCTKTGNIEAAKLVGKAIAEKAKAAGIERVAFDRSGFQYHGRVKALADAAREHGLEF